MDNMPNFSAIQRACIGTGKISIIYPSQWKNMYLTPIHAGLGIQITEKFRIMFNDSLSKW